MFSQIKDRKQFEHNFHSVVGIMPQGWDLGVLDGAGWSTTLACAQSTPHYNSEHPKNYNINVLLSVSSIT